MPAGFGSYATGGIPQKAEALAAFLRTELRRIQGAIKRPRTVSTAVNYSVTPIDDVVVATAAITVSLPLPSLVDGLCVTIKRRTVAGNVTIGATVDGVVNPTLTADYQAVTVQSDGTVWYNIAAYP